MKTSERSEDAEREWLEWLKAERDRLQELIETLEGRIAARTVNEYDKQEAAAFLGVTSRTIEHLTTRGELHPRYISFKHGRKALYRQDELDRLREGFASTSSSRSTARPGYVYVLGTPDGYYKIGLSRVYVRRVADIAMQLPYQVELIHLITTQNMGATERALHQRFAGCRMNGEWFRLSTEDLSWLKSHTSLEAEEFDAIRN